MKGVVERLNYVWSTLLSSNIVQDPNATSDEYILEFTRILNKSAPVTPVEKASHDVLRHIFIQAKEDFVRLISHHDMTGLLLACDGTTIARELGIAAKVDIRWNAGTSEYFVSRVNMIRDPRADRPARTDRPRDERPRGDRPRNNGRGEGRRDYNDRGDIPQTRSRDESGRGRGRGNDRPAYNQRGDREDRPERTDRPPREYQQDRPLREYQQDRPLREYQQDRPPRTEQYDDSTRSERSDHGEPRSVSKYDKNKERNKKLAEDKKGRPNRKDGIPPISSQDQVTLLKQLRKIKTYSEAAADAPAATEDKVVVNKPVVAEEPVHAVPMPVAAAPAETVVITNEDIQAISAAFGV